MAVGTKDGSKTRVQSASSQLDEVGGTTPWLSKLLRLGWRFSEVPLEVELKPPLSLLRTYIETPKRPRWPVENGPPTHRRERVPFASLPSPERMSAASWESIDARPNASTEDAVLLIEGTELPETAADLARRFKTPRGARP